MSLLKSTSIFILLGLCISLCTSIGATPIQGEVLPLNPNYLNTNDLAYPFVFSNETGKVVACWVDLGISNPISKRVSVIESDDYGVTWSVLPYFEFFAIDLINIDILRGEINASGDINIFIFKPYFPGQTKGDSRGGSMNTAKFDRSTEQWTQFLDHDLYGFSGSGDRVLLPVSDSQYKFINVHEDAVFTIHFDSNDGGETWGPSSLFQINGEAPEGNRLRLSDNSSGTYGLIWRNYENLNGAQYGNKLYYTNTLNAGQSWTPIQQLAIISDSTASVVNEMAASDNVWVCAYKQIAYGNERNLYILRSTDNGQSWGVPQLLYAEDNSQDTYWVRMKMLAQDDTFLIVWQADKFDEGSYSAELLYCYSEDFGLTWSPDIELTPGIDATERYFDLAPEFDLKYIGEGTFIVAFTSEEDYMGAGTDKDIFYTTLTFPDLIEEPVEMPVVPSSNKPIKQGIFYGGIVFVFIGLFARCIKKTDPSHPD